MTYPRQLSAVLLDKDGTSVVSGTPLASAFGLAFMDELNGAGSGQMSIPLSVAGSAQVIPGRFVQVYSESTPIFAFMIEGSPQIAVVDQGEEHDQILTVSGRGNAGILDMARVNPEVDLDLDLDSSWRLFSFASPTFPNDGGWVSADELYEYLEGVTYGVRYQSAYGQYYPSPISFPWPTSRNVYDPDSPPGANYVNTYWIWPPGEELSLGYAFFRNTFTIPDDGTYTFAVTADNYFTLFLEGVPILGEQSEVHIWRGWKEISLFLPAGEYTIAAVVQNPDWPVAINPGGFIMNIFQPDDQLVPTTHILSSDDSWICEFSADFWPGWTPGQIVLQLISEAQTRGALVQLATPSFTATTDSASNAYADAQEGSPYVPAFAADVGATMLAALNKLHEEGHIDWHMQPDFTLDVWAPGSLGTDSGADLVAGTNLRSLERGATSVYANSLLVHWDRGYVEVKDSGEIASYGTAVEDIYESQASSKDEAIRRGEVELQRRIASGWPAIVVEIEPTSTTDCPYEGILLGETVTIPAVGGGTEQVQVLAFTVTTDEEGYAIWRAELGRRWRNVVREDDQLLREIGGRSGYLTGVVK